MNPNSLNAISLASLQIQAMAILASINYSEFRNQAFLYTKKKGNKNIEQIQKMQQEADDIFKLLEQKLDLFTLDSSQAILSRIKTFGKYIRIAVKTHSDNENLNKSRDEFCTIIASVLVIIKHELEKADISQVALFGAHIDILLITLKGHIRNSKLKSNNFNLFGWKLGASQQGEKITMLEAKIVSLEFLAKEVKASDDINIQHYIKKYQHSIDNIIKLNNKDAKAKSSSLDSILQIYKQID
jgi:hypothetical protein